MSEKLRAGIEWPVEKRKAKKDGYSHKSVMERQVDSNC